MWLKNQNLNWAENFAYWCWRPTHQTGASKTSSATTAYVSNDIDLRRYLQLGIAKFEKGVSAGCCGALLRKRGDHRRVKSKVNRHYHVVVVRSCFKSAIEKSIFEFYPHSCWNRHDTDRGRRQWRRNRSLGARGKRTAITILPRRDGRCCFDRVNKGYTRLNSYLTA